VKVIVIGATGKIGSEIVTALSGRHEIVRVGTRRGDVVADYTDEASVRKMYQDIGDSAALNCAAGRDSTFKEYTELGDDDYRFGFERKFLGQVRLVRIGESHARDNGSFTLTTGFLSHYPNSSSIATGPFNAAVLFNIHVRQHVDESR
jgi:NAD(P)-dependent dehydrogenase (short-subunit alcohol dehydrogenase family)